MLVEKLVISRDTCALSAASERARTLDSIAATLEVTRERVRQIEAKALKKLREVTTREQLRDILAANARQESPLATAQGDETKWPSRAEVDRGFKIAQQKHREFLSRRVAKGA